MKSQASKTASGNIKLVTTGIVETKVGDPPTLRCKGVTLVIVEHCIIFLYGNLFSQRITSQTSDYTNVDVFRNI